MKKICLISEFFMLFFAVSCDSGLKFENPNDMNSDAYQGDKDSETPYADSDTTPADETDTEPVQINPCDPNPCLNVANSTKECIETGDTTYSCKCNSGFNWIENQCQLNSTPSLSECSASSGTPCRDSSSGLTWSARASGTMTWSKAKSYCESYTEGGLSGWHLPTIDELKTLLIWSKANSCKVSETNNCLAWDSCWTCETCVEQGVNATDGNYCSSSGSSYSDRRYSKFGETGWFWSSSTLSGHSDSAWRVNFGYGYVDSSYMGDISYVRCVICSP